MQLELEDLAYQQQAIDSVIDLFKNQCTFSNERPAWDDVNANSCNLTNEQLEKNKQDILKRNNLDADKAHLSDERQACIEMETGTGKTLVYIRTIYELHQKYQHTKFIILVPSIAIKEGIKNTLEVFKAPLKDRYKKIIHYFEYDSKHLNQLVHFIRDNNPQIMLTTIQAFTADDRILNQKNRDGSIDGKSYLEALGDTRPIIIMDEPQEGMDTELAQKRLETLNPLFIFRYSATHKKLVNRLYRLTPADAYNAGMVKKVEVLSVAEKNDEATLKIELTQVQTKAGQNPKAKLMLWHKLASGFKFKESRWLKVGDSLAKVTNNISYQDYSIERIVKEGGLRSKQWAVETNGIKFIEKERQGDIEGLFRLQLHYLIDTHFLKQDKLRPQGIKCLSLIFIDKVDNYLGDDSLIKCLFAEEYQKVYKAKYNKAASDGHIEALQGYYFARTGKGDFTDSEAAMKKNKKIYDLILKDKEQLLSLENPVEFIFSHSALGVGWDNPNIFNIATLNNSYSEIKKRQELGRGLRICVNQDGQRIYDPESEDINDEINLLTIIPNESYATFALQYQVQVEDELGSITDGTKLRHTPAKDKNKSKNKIKLNSKKLHENDEFKQFWKKLSQKTNFTVEFDEDKIVEKAVKALSELKIVEYQAEVSLNRVIDIDDFVAEEQGREISNLNANYSSIDIIEAISEETSLCYKTVFEVVSRLEKNGKLKQLIKNPPLYMQLASQKLKRIELEEMYRTTSYQLTGEYHPELKQYIETASNIVPTPNKGIYDHVIYDSNSSPEREFSLKADDQKDSEIICFLKLPATYKIPTPVGTYTPDFAIVLKRTNDLRGKNAQNYWFIIETKGTGDLHDGTLREDEYQKICYAIKHFEALGIPAIHYIAPVNDYERDFKDRISDINNPIKPNCYDN